MVCCLGEATVPLLGTSAFSLSRSVSIHMLLTGFLATFPESPEEKTKYYHPTVVARNEINIVN